MIWRIFSMVSAHRAISNSFIVLLFLGGLLIFFSVDRFNGNLSGFLMIGNQYLDFEKLTGAEIIYPDTGYDGQFYYAIAQDPFMLGDREKMRKSIDTPYYRYQRILFPFLAYVISGGQTRFLAHAFILINLVSIGIGVYLVGNWCQEMRISTTYSLFYGFSLGLLLSTMRDLAEPLAVLFLLIGIIFHFRRKSFFSALFFSLSVLTKETMLLFPASLLLYYLLRRCNELWKGMRIGKGSFTKSIAENQIIFFFLPFLFYALWQFVIFSKFQVFSYQGGRGGIGIPFKGMIQKILSFDIPEAISFVSFFELIFFVVILIALGVLIFLLVCDFNEMTAISLGFIFFVFFFTKMVWGDIWSFGRVTQELFVMCLLIFVTQRKRLALVPLVGNTISFWTFYFALLVRTV